MSSVPSINAFVAAHSYHNDANTQNQALQQESKTLESTDKPIKNVEVSIDSKPTWFGNLWGKLSFSGHDGFTVTPSIKNDESSPTDTKSLKSNDEGNSLSRSRHFSTSSTVSVDESIDRKRLGSDN